MSPPKVMLPKVSDFERFAMIVGAPRCGTTTMSKMLGDHPSVSPPFVKEPHRYYCPDGLHPSGEGYALWFATLVAQVPLARFLAGSD